MIHNKSIRFPDEYFKSIPNFFAKSTEIILFFAAHFTDTNRAANHILRMTLSGQIVMTLLPPGFVAKEDAWQTHEGISDVEAIKALGISEDLVEVDENFDSDSENEDGKS